MTDTIAGQDIRACADAVIRATAAHGHDSAAITEAITPSFARLLARDDLLGIGVPRPANHVAMSWYLYYDTDLYLLIYPLAKGHIVPVHDHGNWESMFVWRGAVHHTVYERSDDLSVPGRATLRALDDRVLKQGDSAVVAPPADIHGFSAITDGTYAITVASGLYKAERHYYNVADGTYAVRNPKAA